MIVGSNRIGRHGRLTVVLSAVLTLAAAIGWAQSPAPSSTKPKSSAPSTSAPKPATPAKPKAAAPPTRPVPEVAHQARELEDIGAYANAVTIQRGLRVRAKLDPDLELALAINEGRSGAIDSALARLSGPILSKAALDSMPLTRRHEYAYVREGTWINGGFDGWHWYVWRARAELLALRGRWNEALEAARGSVAARALCGKDWLILAVCAGRAGQDEEARMAAERAAELDPTLPEAFYLSGLWDWKQGRRSAAAARFRQAVALDSAFAPAALALVRLRLPVAAADTLPTALLTGVRRVALVTSPMGPKPEEFHQMDVSATLFTSPDSAVVDSLIPGVKPVHLVLSVLVDVDGRTALNEVPWFPPGQFDFRKVIRILQAVPTWVFNPAQRFGRPQRVWVSIDFYLNP